MFDYSRIKGQIKEKFNTQAAFAKVLGVSTACLSDKLNNKGEWTQSEMLKIVELFGAGRKQIPAYFFCLATQEPEKGKSHNATHK